MSIPPVCPPPEPLRARPQRGGRRRVEKGALLLLLLAGCGADGAAPPDDRLTLLAGETRLRSEEFYEGGATITSYATRFEVLGPPERVGEQVEVIFFAEYETFAWRDAGSVLCARVDARATEPCGGEAAHCTVVWWNAVAVLSEGSCP